MTDTLELVSDLSYELVAALEEELYAHSVEVTGLGGGATFGVVKRDAAGALLGGLYATTWAGWLDIRLLWVRQDARGQGLGSRLLGAAESEALARGCHSATLETHSFQAPAFYVRHGYTIFATLDGYPPGHSKQYLRKSLRAAPAATDTESIPRGSASPAPPAGTLVRSSTAPPASTRTPTLIPDLSWSLDVCAHPFDFDPCA